jgi:pyrimidine operon attenuation protein/uracil phosphoribosyltransferase
MDAEQIGRALTRISHEILERHKDLERLGLIGIRTRGVTLAERIADTLEKMGERRPPGGVLDINLYRDDLSRIAYHPMLRGSDIAFDLTDRRLVLVDDVLFTGRTIRAALEALIDLGRPGQVQLAVLIDRGHRELPIRPDFVGKNVPTARADEIQVRLAEDDGVDEVLWLKSPDQADP